MTKRISIFLVLTIAAALSVVSIPAVAALINHYQGADVTLFIGIAASGILALIGSFLFTASTYRSISIMFGKFARIDLEKLPERQQPDYEFLLLEGPAEVRLLLELMEIERKAQTLLGEKPNTSIIRLRSRLQELDKWSKNDVYDFDVALNIRNKIAHGDREELSEASVTRAIETMRRLRLKLEASQMREAT